MGTLKTKDAADLLTVSQTTIKRWASTFPNHFQKDRFGHYTFSEQEIDLLIHIKDRIDQGETLNTITLMTNPQPPKPFPAENPQQTHDPSMEEMLNRIEHIERSIDQKADEVVSVQLHQQREELDELRQMIKQLAASIETIQTPSSKTSTSHDECHPADIAKLETPPKKRGLLRSFFSFL